MVNLFKRRKRKDLSGHYKSPFDYKPDDED